MRKSIKIRNVDIDDLQILNDSGNSLCGGMCYMGFESATGIEADDGSWPIGAVREFELSPVARTGFLKIPSSRMRHLLPQERIHIFGREIIFDDTELFFREIPVDKTKKENNIKHMNKKLHNGSIYNYRGRTVRLHKQVGAVSVIRSKDGKIQMGRTDLLSVASRAEVEGFRAAMRK